MRANFRAQAMWPFDSLRVLTGDGGQTNMRLACTRDYNEIWYVTLNKAHALKHNAHQHNVRIECPRGLHRALDHLAFADQHIAWIADVVCVRGITLAHDKAARRIASDLMILYFDDRLQDMEV